MKYFKHSWTALFLVLSLGCTSAMADRIKDLTTVAAMRTNQLIGYGLVVGLQGTGDGSDVSFTAQSMKTLLNRLGVSLEGPLSDFETATSAGKIDIKNVAAVMVTAELPGFAKPGNSAVTMTAAVFLMSILPELEAVSKSDKGPSKLTPKRLSKVFMLCAVKETSAPSPEPFKPTTKP